MSKFTLQKVMDAMSLDMVAVGRMCLCVLFAVDIAGSLWTPAPNTSWHWQLDGTLDMTKDVRVYDIDLFDTSASKISTLHGQGRIVVCYFSAGSYEAWRPDASSFPDSLKGQKMGGWDELWLDISQLLNTTALRDIMRARLDLAVAKGCDGVEPDNVDAYQNNVYTVHDPTKKITAEQQLTYNKWLSCEAHYRNLSVGLKNDLGQVGQLLSHFDWALNEQCNQYSECDLLDPFVQAGKAVFGVEYTESGATTSSFCPQMNAKSFDFLLKNQNLKAYDVPCRTYANNGPVCGDNVCSIGESSTTCATDCAATPAAKGVNTCWGGNETVNSSSSGDTGTPGEGSSSTGDTGSLPSPTPCSSCSGATVLPFWTVFGIVMAVVGPVGIASVTMITIWWRRRHRRQRTALKYLMGAVPGATSSTTAILRTSMVSLNLKGSAPGATTSNTSTASLT